VQQLREQVQQLPDAWLKEDPIIDTLDLSRARAGASAGAAFGAGTGDDELDTLFPGGDGEEGGKSVAKPSKDKGKGKDKGDDGLKIIVGDPKGRARATSKTSAAGAAADTEPSVGPADGDDDELDGLDGPPPLPPGEEDEMDALFAPATVNAVGIEGGVPLEAGIGLGVTGLYKGGERLLLVPHTVTSSSLKQPAWSVVHVSLKRSRRPKVAPIKPKGVKGAEEGAEGATRKAAEDEDDGVGAGEKTAKAKAAAREVESLLQSADDLCREDGFDDAVEACEEAMALARQVLGNEHPRTQLAEMKREICCSRKREAAAEEAAANKGEYSTAASLVGGGWLW
jgi:hypothetical protein